MPLSGGSARPTYRGEGGYARPALADTHLRESELPGSPDIFAAWRAVTLARHT